MNALRLLADERAVLVQLGLAGSISFMVTYTLWHRWWRSAFGCLLFALFLGLGLTMLPACMSCWHLLPPMVAVHLTVIDIAMVQGRAVVPVAAAGFSWLNWHTRIKPDKDIPSIAPEDDTLTLLRLTIPRD